MRNKGYVSFKAKMMGVILLFLIPMFALISILFYQTSVTMRSKTIESLGYSARDISSSIDETISNVYNVSDVFAMDTNLQKYLDQDYTGRETEKKKATLKIFNQIFVEYDLLKKNEKMSAIYTSQNELFNFIDPNMDEQSCIAQLKAMGINDREKLAKFFWYPVQDNFLKSDQTGDVRKDKVIFGSRRVFSRLQSAYVCVHIFALKEETIYRQYASIAEQYGADVYVLNSRGELLSSSNMQALQEGQANPELVRQVMNRTSDSFLQEGKQSIVSVSPSNLNDWITVIAAPVSNVTGTVNNLYREIFLVILVCIGLCCVMLLYLYQGFMEPVARLNRSMKEVYQGNLNAYVESKSNNELGRMIRYYNSMLSSINHNIKEKLQMEKKKKELEMEVLMNQINPHFLYNTLETIVWKSTEAGHADIGRIAASLGRMYRLSISSGDVYVGLNQEIEHVMAYVRIQKNRYEDRFLFDLKTDPEEIRAYCTLKILLQPVVENSFLYAMDGLERPLHIRLGIRVRETDILIKVVDTGIGISKEKLAAVRRQIETGVREGEEETNKRKSTGIGLHNVQERLRLYFGPEYGVKIYSKQGIGTLTTLTIPKLTREEAQKQNKQFREETL